MSSAKAEYVAAAGCCANILWMKSKLTDYDIIYEKVPIFCDNTSAIEISNNPVLHSRTKHIDIRYHFIRDHILKENIELHFIPTQYQLADIFTKPLDEPTFKRLIVELAESSSPDITPKEEPVTLDRPESPNLFLPVTHVEVLPDSKIWVSTPTGEVRGEICITTFRNALRAQYLPHLSLYVPPSSITTVRPWFATIGYNGEIGAKGTLKKSCLPPRWRLLMGQIIQCLGGEKSGLDQISNKDATIMYCLANGVQVDYAKIIWEDLIHKLNKKTREKIVPYPRFISLLLEHMAPKYDNEELTINPTQMCLWTPNLPNTLLQLKRFLKAKSLELEETKSSSAMDTSPSYPLLPTTVVGEMHKEAQQAAGGPTSLGDTSKDGAHLQLSSADFTAKADPKISAPKDSIP
ncbi:hypothetical protein Tco_0247532 [Tanacetum coccineum]